MTADRTIQLPDHGTEGRLWAAVLDVADAQPNGWTLIGALMVMLHAHDHGLDARRTTRDADALVDVRGLAQATRRLVVTLQHLGWQLHPDHPKADDLGFRFVKDGLLFDVLAPDGLGQRTDLTTLPPLKTVPIAGGSRALNRTTIRDVVIESDAFACRTSSVHSSSSLEQPPPIAPLPPTPGTDASATRKTSPSSTPAPPTSAPSRLTPRTATAGTCRTRLNLTGTSSSPASDPRRKQPTATSPAMERPANPASGGDDRVGCRNELLTQQTPVEDLGYRGRSRGSEPATSCVSSMGRGSALISVIDDS